MSFDYNYKFWVATQKDLDDVLKRQEVYKRLKPIDEPQMCHYLFADIYVRYVQLVNKLGYIYHHTFQVQKRDVIKNLTEAATQRLLELKNELKNIELSEFIYIDKTLIEKRLTPEDITVWTPQYFPYWRPINVHEMIYGPRKFQKIDLETDEEPSKGKTRPSTPATVSTPGRISTQTGLEPSSTTVTTVTKTKKKDVQKQSIFSHHTVVEIIDPIKKRFNDVVTLIQSHERARVGRILLTNIRHNPAEYKPKAREDGILVKYKFTHKPTQTMLIPVKRTRFESNYYVTRKDLRAFNYYVKPVYLPVSVLLEDDLSDLDDSEEEQGFEEEAFESGEESSEGLSSSEDEGETGLEMSPEEYRIKMINLAAQIIQSVWRGYRDRKKYKALVERKMLIYGMAQQFRPLSKRVEVYEDRVREAAKHRMIKERYDKEFIQFCEDDRARILRVRSPWIMEDISDNIRAWFREFYDRLNCFHPYPDEAKGGTLLLLKGETLDVYEYQAKLKKGKSSKEEKKKERDKAKALKAKLKAKLKKEKLQLAKKRAKLKQQGIFDLADEMSMSKAIANIEKTITNYKKEWEDIDEKLNKKQEPIKEWITSDHYAEIHQELQLIVDELMRIEYELLQRALAKDKKKKYKPPKKKKGKKGGKKKKKTPKDMTGDRSVESLYYELQDAGIVKTYPRKTFDYFIGDRNLCAFDILNIYMRDTPPYKGEIRDVLREYVLGMGPLTVNKPKGILLVGPTHSGKQLLCDILATEIDAVVLDISPENTTQYASDMKYFLHLIIKMAKILQPTILFIRDAHRVFWKKVPAQFQDMNPRLLQAHLKKAVLKHLKKEDKIILLGTTDAPWTANGKMKKIFPKILLVPKTEYATSFILRRNVSLQTRSIPRDFNFSALALVTRDYATGDLVKNVQGTLNLRRRMQLVKHPLHPMEFIDNFLAKDNLHFPPELKEWEKFAKWFRKASKMAKKRAKMMKLREAQLAKKKKKGKK